MADGVVLDLNGFRLRNTGAAVASRGVWSYQQRNVTIRNGTVEGFTRGVHIDDDSPFSVSRDNIVEGMTLLDNAIGIRIEGVRSVARNNLVSGGSIGLSVAGRDAKVIDNEVSGIQSADGLSGSGISVAQASYIVISGNRVTSVAPTGAGVGVGISLSSGDHHVVSDNRLTNVARGIQFSAGATGTYMNNLVVGAGVPYSGGTAAGATNF